MSEVPKGWTRATLGDLVESQKNGIYKPAEAYDDSGIPCLRMYNIEKGNIVIRDIKRMLLDQGEINDYALYPGDVLLNRVNSRELVGKAALIPDGIGVCVFESKNIRLRPNKAVVNPAFLNYALLCNGREHFSANAQQVVGMASVSQTQVATFPVSLPPLSEQGRIVAKIETLMARNRTARDAIADVPIILDRYRQSVLTNAFHGEQTEGWNYVRFGDVTDFITSGSRGWGEYYSHDGPLFIRVGNFDRFSINLDLNHVSHVQPPKSAEGLRTRIRPNDVMVTITADVGMVGIAPANIGEAYVNQHVALCRPKCGINPRFLAYALLDPSGLQKLVQEIQYGATKASLSLVQVRDFPIPLPPREEQELIVHRLDNMLSRCRSIEMVTTEQLELSERLDKSILAKALSGELVPQGSSDESAEKLLSRIRAKRVSGGAPTCRVRRSGIMPTPAPAPRSARPPFVKEGAAAEPVSKKSNGPEKVNLEAIDLDSLMAAFRQTLATQSFWNTDDELLRSVAIRFGRKRLDAGTREILKGHLRSVLLRRIAIREIDGTLTIGPRTLHAYTRDELIAFIPSVLLKGQTIEREALMRALLCHLGFHRLTDPAQNALKSAINGAIRRGVLEAVGADQVRRLS